MKKLTFLFLVSAQLFILSAQWKQTNGILGGSYSLFSGDASVQIMVSSGNTVFVNHISGWTANSRISFSPSYIVKSRSAFTVTGGYMYAVSTDNGRVWTESKAQFYSSRPPAAFGDSLFQIALDTVFTSANGGKTWIKTFAVDSAIYRDTSGVTKKIRIFVAERPVLTQNGLYALASSSQTGQFVTVIQSTDRGRTWRVTVPVNSVSSTSMLGVLGNSVYLSTNNGVITSSGDGVWSPANTGLPGNGLQQNVTEFLYSPDNLFAVFGGTQGSIYKFINSTWQLITTGNFNMYEIATGDGILFRNTAGGDNTFLKPGDIWREAGSDIIASTSAPMPVSNASIFSFYKNALYYSGNKGVSWYKIKDTVKAVSIESEKQLFLKNTDIFLSRNGATTWQLINSNIPAGDKAQISCFAVSGEEVFVGVSGIRGRTHLPPVWEQGGVYRTTNAGTTWEKVVNGLPQEAGVPAPVSSIYSSDGLVYANTLGGTFRFLNGSWVPYGTFLPSGESLFEVKKTKTGWIAIASKGIYISDAGQTAWKKVVTGLTSNFGYYYQYRSSVVGDSIFLFSSITADTLKILNDTVWQTASLKGPAGKQLYSFTRYQGVYFAGTFESGIWYYDPTSPTGTENTSKDRNEVLSVSAAYPNPSHNKVSFRVSAAGKTEVVVNIYSVTGECVVQEARTVSGNDEISALLSNVPAGIYIYTVTALSNGKYSTFHGKISVVK